MRKELHDAQLKLIENAASGVEDDAPRTVQSMEENPERAVWRQEVRTQAAMLRVVACGPRAKESRGLASWAFQGASRGAGGRARRREPAGAVVIPSTRR